MSRGPEVLLAPKRCITLELKDLADTQDFDLDGTVGELYGFEYTDEGYYKRVEVAEDRKVPKLEQLRNVLDENIYNGFEYKLKRIESKWALIPLIDWEIKFEFTSPYTYFDNNRNFRKAFNAGPIHVSLIPNNVSRRQIIIKPFEKRQYLLHRRNTLAENVPTRVDFLPEITLTKTFTLILDISVNATETVDDVVLMSGVSISWKDLKTEKVRISIAVQRENNEIKSFSSSDNVVLKIDDIANLRFISLDKSDLIGFYFTDRVLPEDMLQPVN